ncbi:MAG: CinA family protein [Candidatus Margulisbacteria bacterium]|nr:CinA family protein [Candidatus Margulisiibacteriota bacterium]
MQKEVKNLDAIPFKVADLIKEKKYQLVIAESITGGDLSANIVRVPGASDFFVGGIVAYSNLIKVRECLVNPQTIQRYGAVSAQVTMEMAKGVQHKYQTQIALATTGFAGPKREMEKVGLVYITLLIEQQEYSKNFIFSGERTDIIKQTSFAALELLRYYLENFK